MLKLYHCPDARSFRCLWLLEEMGLPYELSVMAYPPKLSAPDFLTINPLGTVPVLLDGDSVLTESGAILEYLALRYGPTPLALAPQEAEFGAWLNWIHFGEATLTTPQTVTMRYAMTEPEERRQPMVAEDYAEVFSAKLAALEAALGDRDYLCAGRFTAADICVGYALMLAGALRLGGRIPERVKAYLANLQQRPAYIAARAAQKAKR